jgi:hypothetical protein
MPGLSSWWSRHEVEAQEPESDVGCPVSGPHDTVEFIWTLEDGRGILHPHDPDGCPFEPAGRWAGQAEAMMADLADEPCADCGEVHDGGHP